MEHEILEWLRERSRNAEDILIGIGDDGAVLQTPESPMVVAQDVIAEGTHFDLGHHSLEFVGRKAVAVNLSDMAAMAAKPRFASLGLQLPKTLRLEDVQRLYFGVERIAQEYGVEVIGGDTNRWDGPLVVSVNVIGFVSHEKFWRLDSARPGDAIFVSGDFGGSILGKHLTFQPRCRLANELVHRFEISAATDVSDALVADLHTMCERSGCGARIELSQIPISDAALQISESSGLSPTEHALYDGEDFELILAVPQDQRDLILAQVESVQQIGDARLTQIGEFCEQPGIVARDEAGEFQPIRIQGYEH